MLYLILYIGSLIIGYYVLKKFNLNKKEIIELVSIPIVILLILSFLSEMQHMKLEQLLETIVMSPFALIIGVLFFLPLLLLPTLLILILKQYYEERPMIFFVISSLIGGLFLVMLLPSIWTLFTGMSLSLLSVLVQYYYFDVKRRRLNE